VFHVLEEIRSAINDVAGSREQGCMDEIMDLDHIKSQVEQGLFSWSSCTALVDNIVKVCAPYMILACTGLTPPACVQVIMRVQAPKRDEETKALAKENASRMKAVDLSPQERPKAFCKALDMLLARVNVMRIDACNARLRLIGPVIKDHGIDYEHGKFHDKLNDGTLTLERTQALLCFFVHNTKFQQQQSSFNHQGR